MPLSRDDLFDDLLDQAIAGDEVQRGLAETRSISEDMLRDRCRGAASGMWAKLGNDASRFDQAVALFNRLDRKGWPGRLGWRLITSARTQHVLVVLGMISIIVAFLRAEPGRTGVVVGKGGLTGALVLACVALLSVLCQGCTFNGFGRSLNYMCRTFAALNPVWVLAIGAPFFYASVLEVVSGNELKSVLVPDQALELSVTGFVTSVPACLALVIGCSRRGFGRTGVIALTLAGAQAVAIPVGLFLLSRSEPTAVYTATADLLFAGIGVLLMWGGSALALFGVGSQTAVYVRLAYDERVAETSAMLSREHVLPFLREEIAKYVDDFSVHIDVQSAPGVSQVFDTLYRVPTAATARVTTLLERMPGGSIGLAGSRGSGKTTLMESYCANPGSATTLATMVAAPVEYAAREFLLHLYAKICLEALGGEPSDSSLVERGVSIRRQASRLYFVGLAALCVATLLSTFGSELSGIPAMQWWALVLGIAGVVLAGGGVKRMIKHGRGSAAFEPSLEHRAAERLQEIRFQQSYTLTATGTVKLPLGIEGALSRARGLTRQPMHLPEIVDSLRAFLALASHERGRVVIGIDELDKMKSEAAAEQFLNEIKGIFGIRGVYFLVSVSEEAMSTFERRGLPFRDVFDSTFDEIVWFDHLTASEAITTIDRRVLVPIPFKQLCFTLSGGLPRDLVRVVRTMLEKQNRGTSTCLSDLAQRLVEEDVRRKTRAVAVAARRLDVEPHVSQFLLACDEVARRAVDKDTLVRLIDAVAPEGLDLSEVSARQFSRLTGELAGFYYYAATLLEFFDSQALEERWKVAGGESDDGRALVKLTTARQAFATSPLVAWQGVSRFREAWDLEALDLPSRRRVPACASEVPPHRTTRG